MTLAAGFVREMSANPYGFARPARGRIEGRALDRGVAIV